MIYPSNYWTWHITAGLFICAKGYFAKKESNSSFDIFTSAKEVMFHACLLVGWLVGITAGLRTVGHTSMILGTH